MFATLPVPKRGDLRPVVASSPVFSCGNESVIIGPVRSGAGGSGEQDGRLADATGCAAVARRVQMGHGCGSAPRAAQRLENTSERDATWDFWMEYSAAYSGTRATHRQPRRGRAGGGNRLLAALLPVVLGLPEVIDRVTPDDQVPDLDQLAASVANLTRQYAGG